MASALSSSALLTPQPLARVKSLKRGQSVEAITSCIEKALADPEGWVSLEGVREPIEMGSLNWAETKKNAPEDKVPTTIGYVEIGEGLIKKPVELGNNYAAAIHCMGGGYSVSLMQKRANEYELLHVIRNENVTGKPPQYFDDPKKMAEALAAAIAQNHAKSC